MITKFTNSLFNLLTILFFIFSISFIYMLPVIGQLMNFVAFPLSVGFITKTDKVSYLLLLTIIFIIIQTILQSYIW